LIDQIETLEVSDQEREEYSHWICNWSYLSIILQSEELAPHQYAVLIKLEIEGKCRENMIHRLFTRYRKLETQRQWKELKEFYENYDGTGS